MYYEFIHFIAIFIPFVMGVMARDLVDFMHDMCQAICQWCYSLRAMNDDERVITDMQCEQVRACIARARVSNSARELIAEMDEALVIIETVRYGLVR